MNWIKNIEAKDVIGNQLWFQIHQCEDGFFYHNFMIQGEETWYNGCDIWAFETLTETTDHCLDMLNLVNRHLKKS